MVRKQTTKELVLESFVDLLQSRTFESITVQNIADNCQVSRRTFYNCFQDKYDIIVFLFRQYADDCIRTSSGDLYSCYEVFCSGLQRNRKTWKKIFRNAACHPYVRQAVYDTFLAHLPKNTSPEDFSASLIHFYVSGVTSTLADWILNGCMESSDTVARVLYNAIPMEIRPDDSAKAPALIHAYSF